MKQALLLVKLDVHYDFDRVKAALRETGLEVDEFHLFNDDIRDIDLSRYAVIDIRNCRGFQNDQTTFWRKLTQLQNAAARFGTTFVTPADLVSFFGAKGIYLKKLQALGVRINPTVFIDLESDAFDIAGHVANQPQGVMLKPSTGARAWNVYRLKACESTSGFSIIHSTQSQGEQTHQVHAQQVDAGELREFFRTYRNGYQETVLVQTFIPSREFCAVFLGNTYSHMIEKVADESSENKGLAIRHDLFGASMRYVEDPEPELIAFAETVVRADPASFKRRDLPYFRLDIFEDVSPEAREKPFAQRLTLNEVEVMTVHLYLDQAQKVDAYAEAMKKVVMSKLAEGSGQFDLAKVRV